MLSHWLLLMKPDWVLIAFYSVNALFWTTIAVVGLGIMHQAHLFSDVACIISWVWLGIIGMAMKG
jgi:hypothetical protein